MGTKTDGMRTSNIIILMLLVSQAAFTQSAHSQDSKCSVPLFRGATQPQGGEAEMRVVNNGQACGIRNYGSHPDPSSLAYAGTITVLPKNGHANQREDDGAYKGTGFEPFNHFHYSLKNTIPFPNHD